MKTIMKNHRITHERNEYLFFDDCERLRARAVLLPSSAKIIAKDYDFKPISPIDAREMFEYTETSLSDLIPLPF